MKLTFFLSNNYLEFEIVAARGLQLIHQIEPGRYTYKMPIASFDSLIYHNKNQINNKDIISELLFLLLLILENRSK